MANQGGGYLSLLSNKEAYFIQNPDDEDNIQWAIDLWLDYYKPLREGQNIENNFNSSKVDMDIMVCSHCNACWEYGRIPGEKAYYIYSEFPRIGKTNYKICPNCSDWLFNR